MGLEDVKWLLAGVKQVYRRVDGAYRDGMVRVGELLHEFVLAYLRQGDGRCDSYRSQQGISRRMAIQMAATALVVRPKLVRDWIAISQVKQLLAPEGQLGSLSYAALRGCRPLVMRCILERRHGTKAMSGSSAWVVSARETWLVKPPEQATRQLFQQILTENWGYVQIKEALRQTGTPVAQRPRAARMEMTPRNLPNLGQLAQEATTRDLLDMIVSMVQASRKPADLAKAVIGRLSLLSAKTVQSSGR